ncbi:MAG: chloride channel protein, partial [Acidimicrobiia bacterium]
MAMFLGLSLLVGVLVGAGAALLIFSIGWVERGFEAFGDALSLGRYLVLGSVPLAFLAAWWIAGRFAPEVGGDGVPETAAALTVRAGYLPSRTAPLKILATAITLGGGGSAGREGPIVQIGGAIGSSLARYSRLGEDQIRSLVAAGAGAAIGASFNAPIAGMLFAMEVILGHFAVRHLNAVVVASVAAAVTSRSLVGEERILQAFPYRVVDARELLLYALLGVLVVGVAYVFLRVLNRTDTTQDSQRWPSWVRPVALGLAVAALGVAEPRILRTGQEFVGELLQISAGGIEVWWVLFLLAGVKILATAGTIGSGASGGAFMPSLFIGATLGAGFAQLLDPVWNFSELQPGAFAVVGMAATFAAVARAPLTAIIIVFEITGDYALVLALMLAAALATFGIDRIHPDSVYTMPLARRGIRLTRTSEVDLLDTVTVGEVMSGNPTLITPTMTTGEVQGTLDRHRHHGLSVVDDRGRLIGIVTVTDIL